VRTFVLQKQKSLEMRPLVDSMQEKINWEYAMSLSEKPNPMNKSTPKGSQFEPTAVRILRCLRRMR